MSLSFRYLRAKNFKCFRDTGPLELADLNLFVGPNSAGKSSILHLLLVLKQTLEDANPDNHLLTDGKYIELGSFSDVVFNHEPKSTLSFALSFDESIIQKMPLLRARRMDRNLQEIAPLSFSIDFAATPRAKRIYPRNFSLMRKDGTSLVSGTFSSIGKLKSWETLEQLPKRKVSLFFNHFVPMFSVTGGAAYGQIKPETRDFLQANWSFSEACSRTFEQIVHFKPIRIPIRPFYRVTGESPSTVGPTGENLLGVLFRDEKRRRASRRNLLRHLNYWLDEKFGLVTNIRLEALSKSGTLYALIGKDSKTGVTVNLTAVGFGVSQVAPIIVEGFLVPRDTCFVIEQPEIHLHPNAQADLGDLFIEFARQEKQMLIETHSQYMLFRILRRVAEGALSASKVRIYFVSRSGEGSKVEPLLMDERGRISNWPKGFFEEGYEETAAMAEALVKG